jgi:hypothetical protein
VVTTVVVGTGAGTVLVVLEYETQPAKAAASTHPKDRHFIMTQSPELEDVGGCPATSN